MYNHSSEPCAFSQNEGDDNPFLSKPFVTKGDWAPFDLPSDYNPLKGDGAVESSDDEPIKG